MKKLFTFLIISCCMWVNSIAQETKQHAVTPIKPALLVIDTQNGYLQMIPAPEREKGLMYINALIQLFRDKNCPIIRIYHNGQRWGVVPGTEGFEFPSSILVKPDDPKVIKTYGDAFNKTELDQLIKQSGSNTLFLCGLSATACVLATYIGAQNHDYHAFMVKNAIMSGNSEHTQDIETIFEAISYDAVELIINGVE